MGRARCVAASSSYSTLSSRQYGRIKEIDSDDSRPLPHSRVRTIKKNLILSERSISRYCGYVPQFKYQIGQTFGNHTHQLLTDPRVPSSSRPVLSDTSPPARATALAKTKEDFFSSPVYQQRQGSLGDQKYVAQMVPGYTGKLLA